MYIHIKMYSPYHYKTTFFTKCACNTYYVVFKCVVATQCIACRSLLSIFRDLLLFSVLSISTVIVSSVELQSPV